MVGTSLVYTVTVVNNGPGVATDVVVEDTMPPGIIQLSASFSQGGLTTTSNGLSWAVGILGVGSTARVDIAVRPMVDGVITNMVTATMGPTDTNLLNNTASVTTTVNPAGDSDGDGMPDWWESLYFGGNTNGMPGVDADGDGISNLGEYVAYTDPFNVQSALVIKDINPVNDIELRFDSAPARLYIIQCTTNMISGSWTNILSNITGDGSELSVTHTNSAPAAFYRLKVTLP